MTAIFEDLKKIGLTENQTLVYLTLARAEAVKAGQIIKKTGLHRNIVYTALDELKDKRLVSSSLVRGVAVYRMLSPSRLLADIEERERVARNVVEELMLLSKTKTNQEIITYEGVEEFRRHARRSYELAKQGSTYRYLGTSPHWHTVISKELETELNALQVKKKIYMRGIAREQFRELKRYLRETKPFTEIRINPLISSDVNNIEILEDRVSIQSFAEPYFVVEIINTEVTKNYQNYFDFLWSKSK